VPIASTLLAEAFGRLSPDGVVTVSDHEDLYSVFRSRAELMSWGTSSGEPRRLLWGMNEASLSAEAGSPRMGYVQVGVEPDVEPAIAAPPLLQCLEDSLRRLGALELTAIQLTAMHLRSRQSSIGPLTSWLNWFNLGRPAAVQALVSFDADLMTRIPAALAIIQRRNTGSFSFGSLTRVPGEHVVSSAVAWSRIGSGGGEGLLVNMPEWTGAAAGWVVATVLDTTRSDTEDRECGIRITRLD